MQLPVTAESHNPARAAKDWPPVVVGGAFQTGLNLMRDLLRRGVRTVAVDFDLTHEGFRSVYGKTHHCPNPDTHGEEWLTFMKQLSAELGQRPVFIPAADIFIAALGRHAADMTGHYLNSPEAAELQARLCSKDTQYALCAEHGFPCPRLAHIGSRADLDDFLAHARFPCLIKPLSPREWDDLPPGSPAYGMKVVIAQDATELRDIYDSVMPHRAHAIAQEVIAGLGDRKRVYMSVFATGGRLLAHCLVQPLRPHPALAGMPQVVAPVKDEPLTNLCAALLQKLNYRGICEFEFKIDERDNGPRLIEINPRFSGTGDSASYMGIETGWLHYLDVIGHNVVPQKPVHFDYYHIGLKLEAKETVPGLLDGSVSWKEFFAAYSRRRAFFDFDWRDPRLAFSAIVSCVRYAAGAIWRHFRGRS